MDAGEHQRETTVAQPGPGRTLARAGQALAGGVGTQELTAENVTAHDQLGVVGNGARPSLGVLSMVLTSTFAGWCDDRGREPTQMAPATATGVDPARARAQRLPAVELLMNHRTLR